MSETITALIPLKWHSERVPGKNVRPFCGKPLFHWIVESLAASRHIGQILIDTDSADIAAAAAALPKVRTVLRPERLRGDMVGITPLIEFELSQVSGDRFLQTHSTNPLLTTRTIDAAIEAYLSSAAHDSLFTVTPWRKRFYTADGRPVNHDPKNMLRTQDLPPILEENSNLYLFTRDSFLRNAHRIGSTPILFPMDPLEAVDIDEESDFTLAESLMAARLALKTTQEIR